MTTYNDLRALITSLQAKDSPTASGGAHFPQLFDLSPGRDDTLGNCDRKLFQLSAERVLLSRALSSVETEYRRGQIARGRALNCTVPIGRLPNEILSIILERLSAPNVWRHPALATCHRWRTCAINDPHLWRQVFIRDRTTTEEMHTWAARAGALPLWVRFNFVSSPFAPEMFHIVLQYLNARSLTIFKLKITLGPSYQFSAFFPMPYNFEHLRRLSLHWHGAADADQAVPIFTPRPVPPALARLVLHNNDIAPNSLSLAGVNCRRLTYLRIGEEASPQSILAILTECEALETLEWDLHWIPSTAFTAQRSPLVLPKLAKLNLRGQVVPAVLDFVEMPALQRLLLSSYQTHYDIFPAITRHTNITYLELKSFPRLTIDEMRRIFTSFPHLELLMFEWMEMTLPAIQALAEWSVHPQLAGEGPTWNCPRMNELYLDLGTPISQHRLLLSTVFRCLEPIRQLRQSGSSPPFIIFVDNSSHTLPLDGVLGVQRIPVEKFPKL